jgi:uncharacterized protein YxjI
MRLLIKQRVFSWTDSYDVYDENENAKYFVKAEFFSLGHQLHIYDRNDRELGVIRQRLFTLLPAFEIEINGQVKGEIRKQFSFFIVRITVSSSTKCVAKSRLLAFAIGINGLARGRRFSGMGL